MSTTVLRKEIVFRKPTSLSTSLTECKSGGHSGEEKKLKKKTIVIIKMSAYTTTSYIVKNVIRAGTIPWCQDLVTKERKFWFGIHSYPRQLTDYGGMVEAKLDGGNPVVTAYREWDEEGCRAWGPLDISSHRESKIVISDNMLLVFVKVPNFNVEQVKQNFRLKSRNLRKREVVGITQVSESDILSVLTSSVDDKENEKENLVGKSGFPFYDRVFDFLSRLENFNFLE